MRPHRIVNTVQDLFDLAASRMGGERNEKHVSPPPDPGKSRPARGTTALRNLGEIASSSLSAETVSQRLVEEIGSSLPFDRMVIAFVDLESGTFTDACMSGIDIQSWRPGVYRLLEGTVIAETVEAGTSMWVGDSPPQALESRFPALKPDLDAGIRSVLAIPLLVDQQMVACLTLSSLDPGAYSDHHLKVADRIGPQIAEGIARSKQFTELEREAADLAALADIGQFMTSAPDVTEVYEGFAHKVGVLVPYDRLEIALLDLESDTGVSVCVVGAEIANQVLGRTFDISGSPTEAIVTSHTGIVEGEPPEALTAKYAAEEPSIAAGFRSMIMAPMVSGQQVIASLTLRSFTPDAYTSRDLTLAERVATQVAGTVANSRLYDKSRGEAVEGPVLAEIGVLTGSSSDIEQTYPQLADKVRDLIPFDRLVIVLLDSDAGKGTTFISGLDIPGFDAGASYVVGDEAIQALLGAGSGTVFAMDSDEELAARIPGWGFISSGRVRSMVAAPIVSNGQPIGIMILGSTGHNAYTHRELDLSRRICSQIAGAIAAAQLQAALRGQEIEQMTLAEIGRLVASEDDIGSVYDGASERLRRLISFDRIDIAAVDLEAKTRTLEYVSGLGLPGDGRKSSDPLEGSIAGEAIGSRSPLVVQPDDPDEIGSRFPSDQPAVEAGIRSFLTVPLASGDAVVGALSLVSTTPRAYAQHDMDVVQQFADHLAAAIVRHGLRSQLRQRVEEGGALMELGRTISTALSIDEMFDGAAEQVRRLLPFDRIDVATVNAEGVEMVRRYATGIDVPGGAGPVEPLAGSVVEEAVRSRAPFLFQAESAEEAAARFARLEQSIEAGLRAFLATPIRRGDTVVGAVTFSSIDLRAYGERDLEMAERIGLLLAGLVAGIAPYDGAQERERRELKALAEISRIVTSSLDVGEVYEQLAEQVRILIPFDRIVIWTVDLHHENLIASYTSAVDVPDLDTGTAFPLSKLKAHGAFPEGAQLPSNILVPIGSNDEIVGMLNLGSATPDSYTKRDVATARRIAGQIAGALANAQVYVESKQVEEAVREVVQRMDLAVRGSSDGLWDWKVSENEVWWSPRMKELVGFEEHEDDAGPRGLETRLHPADRERVLSSLNDHLERGTPYDVEYRLRTGSGDYRWFSDRGQAIRDESGRAIRMSGSLRDITDPKEGGAPGYPGSADLRLPLTVIESFRQALLEGRTADQDGDGSVIVTRATLASRRTAQLVDDLRTLSRAMESELRRESVDLSSVCRSVARKLRRGERERNVRFSIARGLVVDGDPGQLRVMMEHLLGNSWKYTSKHPSARIEVGTTERAGARVHYVRDDGAGFDTARAEKLFGLFQRLHPTTEFEGTGVGLATVRHIVRRHGGAVWAEGQVDAGATVYFSL